MNNSDSINIYKNYGVLAAEKRNVYTYGAEHPHAACSDVITVSIPEGWELCKNQAGKMMVTAPWGWDYDINEVLSGDKFPGFSAVDKDGREYIRTLKAIDPDAVEIAAINVLYEAGESRQNPGKVVDYMLAEVDGVELYAEAENDGEETATYEALKAEISRQAKASGIDPARLHFWLDN